MKLESVKQNGSYIRCIKNPNYSIKLEAVKQNGLSLKYIGNPDERLCMEAIKNNLEAMCYIKPSNQTQEMLDYLFENYEKITKKLFNGWKNLSKRFIKIEYAMIMIQYDPYNINYIDKRNQKEILKFNELENI